MNRLSLKTKSHILFLIVIMIVATVFSGFAIVWMQQQISRTAERSQQVESGMTEVVRRLSYVNEKIATMHQPIVLQSKVANTLRPSLENQIVWVREREALNGRTYATVLPYSTSSDLALVNNLGQR
ncbi:MAG: type II secretory pathway pseudopilin PulG [Lentimonas sp.]|jgi:type II secretory pathway pseudopilin PulG